MEMSRLGPGPEFDLIRSFLDGGKHFHPTVRVGPGDDCAVIGSLAISTDASVEGVHFRREWLSAEEIGWRAAGAALSDLAAIAAEPIGVLVSLCVPSADRAGFAAELMRGVVECARSYNAGLLGGDTTASEQTMVDIVVIGRSTHPVLRSHARAGDEVWVTGRLGGAAAAVAAWQKGSEPNAEARARYVHPVPRVREARWLQRHTQLHAMLDLSDGLYGDVAHLAAASAHAIVIDPATVPIDTDAGADIKQALAGGEDYEICFAAAPHTVENVREQFEREFGVALTRIGRVEAGEGVLERAKDGSTRPVTLQGFQHFKG
jgi:thiamine-monophosphate kinase